MSELEKVYTQGLQDAMAELGVDTEDVVALAVRNADSVRAIVERV